MEAKKDKRKKKKTRDEIHELNWNFKLMLRTAFPEGIGISHIESQYEDYVGVKLEFSTFKSSKYRNWNDLFTTNSVLNKSFYLGTVAGELRVKIQPTFIKCNKQEIQRMIQLGCYREHKLKLDKEADEEKPKPVAEAEEENPKYIDGFSQVEIPTKEVSDKETQTGIHGPPLSSIVCLLPPPPPLAEAGQGQQQQSPLTGHGTPVGVQGDTVARIEELFTRRPKSGTLERLHGILSIQNTPVSGFPKLPLEFKKPEVRTESSVTKIQSAVSCSAPDDSHAQASLLTPPVSPSPSCAETGPRVSLEKVKKWKKILVDRANNTTPVQGTEGNGETQPQPISQLEPPKPAVSSDGPSPLANNRNPDEDGRRPTPEVVTAWELAKTPKTEKTSPPPPQLKRLQEVVIDLTTDEETPAKKAKSDTPGGNGSDTISSSVAPQEVPPMPRAPRPTPRLPFRIQFQLTPRPKAPLLTPSFCFQKPRMESSGIPSASSSKLERIPSLFGSNPSQVSGNLWNPFGRSTNQERGSGEQNTNRCSAGLVLAPAPMLPLPPLRRLDGETLQKFDTEFMGVKLSFLSTSINLLKGVSLYDQPLSELCPLDHGNHEKFFGNDWCAYFVQDNQAHNSEGTSRGFYLGEEKKTFFLTAEGWKETDLPKLPPNSLIYGEFVIRNGDKKRLYEVQELFHLIDAAFLDGKDISKQSVYTRRAHCKEFLRNFPTNKMKLKHHQYLSELEGAQKSMWVRGNAPTYYDGSYFVKITGIEFIPIRQGYGNLDFASSMRNRYLWSCPPIQEASGFPGPELKILLESKFNVGPPRASRFHARP